MLYFTVLSLGVISGSICSAFIHYFKSLRAENIYESREYAMASNDCVELAKISAILYTFVVAVCLAFKFFI